MFIVEFGGKRVVKRSEVQTKITPSLVDQLGIEFAEVAILGRVADGDVKIVVGLVARTSWA